MRIKKLSSALAIVGLCTISGAALATNGYFSHGYGIKAKGMGGAATAMSIDTMGGANNPASMVWVGDRLDFGVDYFRPIRSARRVGSQGGFNDFNQDSDTNNFFIPEFGYNKMLSNNLSLGVSVYGNGGLNTDYRGNTNTPAGCDPTGMTADFSRSRNALCGRGELGVNLEQLIIAPTLAYKINNNHSIGISPLIGYQRFKANGLEAFSQISNDPRNLTNDTRVGDKESDDAWGLGVRIGWQGKITDTVTLGAAYASKVYMQEFDKYRGLFAEQGDFDIPENFNVGVAWKATPGLTLALDYQRINYSGVAAVSNSSQQAGCTPNPPAGPANSPNCLGGSNGIGFGWQSIDVWKLGVEFQATKALTLRAGYNHGDNPIRSRDVTFNILATGVVQDHATLGMTYAVSPNAELTVSYMHAFENSTSGPTNPTYFRVGGTETIKMKQDSLGVAYSLKF